MTTKCLHEKINHLNTVFILFNSRKKRSSIYCLHPKSLHKSSFLCWFRMCKVFQQENPSTFDEGIGKISDSWNNGKSCWKQINNQTTKYNFLLSNDFINKRTNH